MANAYAIGRTNPSYPADPDTEDMLAGQDRFAIDKTAGNAPYDAPGNPWAPTLKDGPESIPDDARLQQRPLRQSYPMPGVPPTQGYYPSEDADKKARHSVEQVEGIPQDFPLGSMPGVNPALGANRWAPNPRATPPAPSRITNLLAPISYFFQRPFMHGTPKNITPHLDGTHFSMADHHLGVAYAEGEMSMGMIPPRKPGGGTRNTFRLSPTPWDTAYTDMPPATVTTVAEAPPAVSVVYTSRSWRLGG
jgi:hypothetical protein